MHYCIHTTRLTRVVFNQGGKMKTKYLILIAVLTGVVALTGCLGGSSASGPPAGGELEGIWTSSWSTGSQYFTFSGSNFNYTQYWINPSDTLTWSGTFTSNTTVTPKTIDYLCSSSPDTSDIGKTALGIYELNSTSTQLTLEFNDFGDTVRPTTFGSAALVLTKQ
jgi:uncharacterized protein (TIGR03067 family)